MPTIEAIRKITIQASAPGIDPVVGSLNNLSAAQNRVALSANQLQISMASAQKLIDDNVQKLQALKSANDNVGASYADLIGKARDVSGSFSETVENILNTINHLKLLAVAAYAMSPALRSIVNADVAKALGPIPPVALAAGKSFLSFAAPALSFFGRIALPIGVAVAAWQGLNYTIGLGAGLLDKYGNSERALFGSGLQSNLDALTKLQNFNSDKVSLPQQAYAGELADRLAQAKFELSQITGVQINLTDAALKFQAVWVNTVEAVTKVATVIDSISITMADIGSLSFFKWLNDTLAGGPTLPGHLPFVTRPQLAPPGTVAPPDVTSAQSMAIARGQLGAGLDVAAIAKLNAEEDSKKTQAVSKYSFPTFFGRFSQDVDALSRPWKAPDDTTDAYDRQIETIKNQISQLKLEADGAGKTSQAVQELKTAHDLNDAAMKANIPVTQAMRDQWKAYADTIANLNIQIKQQKALQDEQFKGATMFLPPDQSAAAGVAHGIDPNNWQAHLNDPAAQGAAFNEQLKQSSSLATSFADSYTQGMLQGATATQALTSALTGLESKLINLLENQLINNLFGDLSNRGPPAGGGLFGWLGGLFGPAGASSATLATWNPSTSAGAIYHSGGIIGSEGGAMRYVHPSYFDSAPRFHSGGIAGDEVPIVAQRGEGVFTPGQMAAMGGSQVNVNVVNNHPGAAVDIQQQKRPGGGVDITAVITDTVNKHLASGGADGIMRGRYGAQIRARPR